MTIEKLKEKKQDLEADIEELVNKFQKETKTMVEDIRLENLDLSSIEERILQAQISTEIKL